MWRAVTRLYQITIEVHTPRAAPTSIAAEFFTGSRLVTRKMAVRICGPITMISASGRMWSLASISAVAQGLGRVLGAVFAEKGLFRLPLGEHEENERGAEQDRHNPRGVGPLVALQERSLGAGDDLALVLRVLLGRLRRAGE